MPRVSKADMEKRESFMREFFKGNPDATVEAAQSELKGKFGSKMSPDRAAALHKEVTGKSGGAAGAKRRGRPPKNQSQLPLNGPALDDARAAVAAVTSPPRPRMEKSGMSGTGLVVTVAPESRAALEQAIQALRMAGAQIEIDQTTTNLLNGLRQA